MKTEEQRERDADDIGRILQGLLNKTIPPTELVRMHVAGSKLRDKAPLRIEAGFPALALAPRGIVAAGGGGIVLQCVHEHEPRVNYALKVSRPSLVDKLETLAESQQLETAEFLKHAHLSHRNIARVYGAGKVEVHIAGAQVPLHPILMEWIDHPNPLCEYLAASVSDWRTCVEILAQTFDGMQHLHDAQLIHWDMKSDNVLVDVHGIPRISDMGSARRRDAKNREDAFSTRWNLPPTVEVEDDEAGETGQQSNRRTRVRHAERWDDPWLDLWMLARDLNRIFGADARILAMDVKYEEHLRGYSGWRKAFLSTVFPDDDQSTQYVVQYVRTILRRLLFPSTPQAARYYNSAGLVADDLRNLLYPLGAARNIPELHDVPQHVLRLPVSGNVPYTIRFGDLYNTALVRRLSNHLQLGGLVQIYPGAAHRRYEHSAGVFATAISYVRALYADETDPFWRLNVSEVDVKALLVAAVLHDVGHIAFGHFLEDMEGLFRGRTHEAYAAVVLARDETDDADEMLIADREELREIVRPWCRDMDVQAFLDCVAAILRKPKASDVLSQSDAVLLPDKTTELKTAVLHSVIDSAIDADKLDYLARDAHHCNVRYAQGVDTERFLQSLTTVAHIPHEVVARIDDMHEREASAARRKQPTACIAVTSKGIAPVESMLVARYQMFAVVYWHHTARALTALLHFVVQEWVGADLQRWNSHLDALIRTFRIKSDREALRWLRQEVQKPSRGQTARVRANLVAMCDALLGERRLLAWPAFELEYRPDATDARSVAMWWMEEVDKLNQLAGDLYIDGIRALRTRFAGELARQIEAGVVFEPGDVLLDVPPAGKDQVDNVFVVGNGIRQIQEISPLSDAVRDAFRFWVRKLRVFLMPSGWEKCERAGVSKTEVRDACWRALQPQQALFALARSKPAESGAPRRRQGK